MSSPDTFQHLREAMVEQQLRARGIYDPRVLDVMGSIPRHEFVPKQYRQLAYRDAPLPIGDKQTISQPYIVALMTQMLRLSGHERVLEVGTGSGYQAAILCQLCGYVYSLERAPLLADRAGLTLSRLGCNNVDIHIGDGSQGLPDMAPFDAIIVTAAAPAVPGPLRSQLHPLNGRMVVPVGDTNQQYLQLIVREGERWEIKQVLPVRFVPLVGRYGFQQKKKDDGSGDSPANV